MPWIPSRKDFDNYQENILEDIVTDLKQSWWLQGYPGTGKTMLLIHLIAEYIDAGWDCAFVTFTHALKKLAIEAMKELGHKPGQLHIETVDKMNVLKKKYDIIFVDEVQDLTVKQISKLRELADRFVYAGDLNQSIYLQAAPNEKIKTALGKPKIVVLTDLYRMPEPVFMAANIIYPEAKIIKGAQVTTSITSSINLVAADTAAEEVTWVYEQAKNESRNQMPSAILFGKHKDLQRFVDILLDKLGKSSAPMVMGRDYDPFNEHLKKLKMPMMYYGGAQGGDLANASSSKKILLMTIHSAKGLEFGSVFTPFMNQGSSLCPYPSLLKNKIWQRRCLFMAITRTKLNFYASYSKTLNEFLFDLAPPNITTTLKNNGQKELIKHFDHFHV
jgi:superfamily I DNA/RNA helicase